MSDHPDGKKSRLRAMVAEVDVAMGHSSSAPAREPWQRLVVALELGPEPAVRACPHCGKLGMAEATRCGYCWRPTP